MIAVFVEPVGVFPVARAGQRESRLGGEHIVTKALRGLDERGIGGQQQGVARPGVSAGRPIDQRLSGLKQCSWQHGRPAESRDGIMRVTCPCTLGDEMWRALGSPACVGSGENHTERAQSRRTART